MRLGLLVAMGLLVGAATALVVEGPQLALRVAGARIQRAAAARGWALSWKTVVARGSERIDVRDVGLALPGARVRSCARADRVVVHWRPRSLLAGLVHIEAIEVHGLHLHADLTPGARDRCVAALRRMLGRSSRAPAANDRSSGGWLKLAPSLPRIEVDGGELEFQGLDRVFAGAPERTVLGNLKLTLRDDSVLQGRHRWRLSGHAAVARLDTAIAITGAWDVPDGGRPSLSVRLERPLAVQRGAWSARVGALQWRLGEPIAIEDVDVQRHERSGDEALAAVHVDKILVAVDRDLRRVTRVQVAHPVVRARGAAAVEALDALVRVALPALVGRDATVPARSAPGTGTAGAVPAVEPPAAAAENGAERLRAALAAWGTNVVGATERVAQGLLRWAEVWPGVEVRVEDGQVSLAGSAPGDSVRQAAADRVFVHLAPGDDGRVVFELSYRAAFTGKPRPGRIRAVLAPGAGTVDVEAAFEQVALGALPHLPAWLLARAPAAAVRDFHGTLHWSRAERGGSLDLAGRIQGVRIDRPAVAAQPVGPLDGRLHVRLTVDGAGGALEVPELDWESAEAHIQASGKLHWDAQRATVEAHLDVPRQRLSALLAALPEGLAPVLDGVVARGRLEAHFELSFSTDALADLVFRPNIELSHVRVLEVPPRLRPQRYRAAFDHRIEEPDGTVYEIHTGPGTAHWTAYDDIAGWMTAAVVTTEDARFFQHHGFSPFAMREAIAQDLEAGKFVRGASTISQQVAKNLFLRRAKTLARKLQEIALTWWLEQNFTKEEILALYFNIIEFGPGIYGIRPAAAYYFDKDPADLSLLESLFLVSIVPNPKKYHRMFRRRKLTRAWKSRLRSYAHAMLERGFITQAQFDAFDPDALTFRPRKGPFLHRDAVQLVHVVEESSAHPPRRSTSRVVEGRQHGRADSPASSHRAPPTAGHEEVAP